MLTLRHSIILLLSFLLLAVYVWFQAVGTIGNYPLESAPPGQISYVLAKLFGLFAIIFLWLQVSFGLFRVTAGDSRKIPLSLHVTLGLLTAAMILAHVLLFLLAVWQRKGAFPFDLLLPQPGDYYYTALAFGQIALALVMVVLIAGHKNRNRKRRVSRRYWWLHRLSFIVFALALLHSFMIGSETRWLVMPWVYLFMLVSVALLLIRRLYARRN